MKYWQFWSAPEGWPADRAGFVFLGRALLEIAQVKLPDWRGTEPQTEVKFYPTLDSAIDPNDADTQVRLYALAALNGDGYTPLPPTLGDFSVEQWRSAADIIEMKNASVRNDVLKFYEATTFMADAFAEGQLKGVLREKRGGPFSPELPTYAWYTEGSIWRFGLCAMDRREDHWFDRADEGPFHCYLYVTRESIDELLRSSESGGSTIATREELLSLGIPADSVEEIVQGDQGARASDSKIREVRDFVLRTVEQNLWHPLRPAKVKELIKLVATNATRGQLRTNVPGENWPLHWPARGGDYPHSEKPERETQEKALRDSLYQRFGQ